MPHPRNRWDAHTWGRRQSRERAFANPRDGTQSLFHELVMVSHGWLARLPTRKLRSINDADHMF